jgi:2-dehydropantoate 2-reductase
VDQVVNLLNASGQQSIADQSVGVAIWSKVAFNCAMNAICALAECTVGQLGANPAGRRLALEVVDEVVAVANHKDIAVDGPKVRSTVEHALENHLNHKPSMLQDMLAGRATEINSINGAVADIADKIGVPVPRTRALHSLVALKEEAASSGQVLP